MSDVAPVVWRNGAMIGINEASPSIASISLHMGTGVFDGMMCYWANGSHHIFRGADHFDRWIASSARMNMPVPWSTGQLLTATAELCRQLASQTCYSRPLAYRGGPELWLTGAENRPVDVSIFVVPTGRLLGKPIRCIRVPIQRVSSLAMPVPWKVCGLYVNSYLARRSAEAMGFDDGIMLDRDGNLAEASAANVFLIKDNRLVTPALGGDVFPGITRRTVIEICQVHGLDCVEQQVPASMLDEADGGFLCSTLMEIRPMTQLGSRTLPTEDLEAYQTILKAFTSLTGGT